MTERYKPLLILVALLLAVLLVVVVPAFNHRGIVTAKERIPATRYYNNDGTYRTTMEAYYITIEFACGDTQKFRVSEDSYNAARVGEKYRRK